MNQQKDVAKNILFALGIVGTLSAVMVVPGLAKVLPVLSKVNTKRINQELKRLLKRGLVEIIKRKNGLSEIKITSKGKLLLSKYKIDQLEIDKPSVWDKKWRLIIFDIPISKNSSRVHLRKKLKNLGFYKLQNSVFVYPYPCFEVVTFLRDYFHVDSEVIYLEVEKLENQDILIEYFFT